MTQRRRVANRTLVAVSAVLLALSSGGFALAQAPEDDSSLRENCVGDYFRFCAGYAPGSTGIRTCFSQNISRLTPACRGAIRDFDRRTGKSS